MMKDGFWTIFLDRDGVINQKIANGYVTSPEQFLFQDAVVEALTIARRVFKYMIVVTNQQCVGKGICTEEDIDCVHRFMTEQLSEHQIYIDRIYCCFHTEESRCNCRKPNIGMAMQAKHDFPLIDFSRSIMVGDSLSDLIFGKQCNMKTLFIDNFNSDCRKKNSQYADYYSSRLFDFIKLIK